ncbi:hypothetical protein C8Q74DRAFT_1214956 [Fomes fomentarius]|nr:hypothetical protein C8Q74DRAFT_1214956 [Fomes fomentarius]
MYCGVLSTWFSVLQHTPPGIRQVTLRFQRYGPHTKETMRALEALPEPPHPRSWIDLSPQWFKHIEESLLSRLPGLESLTCALFDGGYTKDWKNFLAEAGIRGRLEGISGESSGGDDGYDDYVAFLIKAFPLLHAQGSYHTGYPKRHANSGKHFKSKTGSDFANALPVPVNQLSRVFRAQALNLGFDTAYEFGIKD